MSLPSGSARSKPPVDDADNIQRFLDAMVRKNLTAFTNSKPMSLKAKTKDEQSASPTLNPLSKPSGSQAIKSNSAGTSNEKPVDDITIQEAEMDNLAGTTNAGPSTPMSPMSPLSPTRPDDLNTFKQTFAASAAPKQAAAVTNTAQPITNNILTSPLSGGVRAPPPTPDAAAAAPTRTVQQIVSDAFGDLVIDSAPSIALGSSRHASPHLKLKDWSQEKDDMPRFFSPAKLLTPEEKQKRDESFQRVLALTSSKLPTLKENRMTPATTHSGGLGDGSSILASRWADNRQGAPERRKSGDAAIPIVDPKTKAQISPLSSATPVLSSQKVNSSRPSVFNASPLLPSRKTSVDPLPASSADPSLSFPSVSAQGNAPDTLQTAPAARSLSITATLTVTSPGTSLNASPPRSASPDPGPAVKQESSAPSTTDWGQKPANQCSTNSGFKEFDNKPGGNETKLYFQSWPGVTGRGAASTWPPSIPSAVHERLTDLGILASRVRSVKFVNLPRGSDAKFVQSLVFGGPLELLTVPEKSTYATVVFQDALHCQKYYDASSNGIVYKVIDGKENWCFVQLGKDPDPVSGLLHKWIEKKATRCVRAIWVDKDWGMLALSDMAKRNHRKVEHIIDSTNDTGVSDIHPFPSSLLLQRVRLK